MIHYENLEFRHLEYIVAVAEERTFTAGAQKVRKGQSNVSRQIAVLERDLGIKIFERDRNGVSLIRAGLLQSTLILLPVEEKIATVFGGDTVDCFGESAAGEQLRVAAADAGAARCRRPPASAAN